MQNVLKIIPGISWRNYIENGEIYKTLGLGDPSYTYTLYNTTEPMVPDVDYPSGDLHIKTAYFGHYSDTNEKFACIALGNYEEDWGRYEIYPQNHGGSGDALSADSRIAYALYAVKGNSLWEAVQPDDLMQEGLEYRWYPVAVELTTYTPELE